MSMERAKGFSLRFKRIRTAILVPILLIFFIGAISTAILLFNGSLSAVANGLKQLQITAQTLVDKELSAQFYEAEQLNAIHQLTYTRALVNFSDQEARESYFSTTLQSFPGAVMTYVAYPNGEFYGARRNLDGTIHVVRNNATTKGHSMYYETNERGEGTKHFNTFENFDPRKRPWYKAATENKALSFTPLYSHFVFKEPTLTASLPVYGQKPVVFGVDFLMTWLGKTLAQLPLGPNGHVIIADKNGKLVASTTGEPEFKLVEGASVNVTLEESENPIIKAITTLKLSSENQFQEVSIMDDQYYVSSSLYGRYGLNWRIYTVIARNDFLKDVYKSGMNTLFTMGGFTVLFTLVALYMTQLIVRPVKLLNESTKRLLDGNFEATPEGTGQDELTELTRSFNQMGAQLTALVDHLEDQVAQRTVELEEKNLMLKDLSYTDALTELANRRRFVDFAVQSINLAARNGRPLAIIMMDIDWFKGFNDTYGHIAGDHCIERIGHTLKSCIQRQVDLCARYGGEEFAAILQETHYEQAKEIAENMRAAIEGLAIDHSASEYGTATISIGLYYGVVLPHQTFEDLTALADKCLYLAKSNGRNRVESICFLGD